MANKKQKQKERRFDFLRIPGGTLFISLQIQYVSVLIKFRPKEVFNVKKTITHIY
jgi:hypothetical protein